MATLLKIGNEYINLDNVIDITDYSNAEYSPQNKLLVEFVGRNSGDYSWTSFEGNEADALRSYLNNTATDVMKPWRAEQKGECPDCGWSWDEAAQQYRLASLVAQ